MEPKRVLCGIDRIADADDLLRGKRIALLTAASGINKQGIPTYRVLAERYLLRVIFAPEHGLFTNLQDGRFDDDREETDPETGVPVCNLGTDGNPHMDAYLGQCDIAVYDIQDVGARFYTYLSNLTQLMRGCVRAGIPLLVLDRPNPIGGLDMEGAILDEGRFSSFIGEFAVPTRYALTVGEYAAYVNRKKKIGCELHVLPCIGWSRGDYYDETDLLFVNPSPNIPSVGTVFNYLGGCIWEATNISEGRGTTRPFDLVGAPFVDDAALWEEMRDLRLPGVIFRRCFFTPQFNKHAGQICRGLQLHVTDRHTYRPILTMLYLFRHMKRYEAFTCRESGLCLRFGTDLLLSDFDPAEFDAQNAQTLAEFEKSVQSYRLYE